MITERFDLVEILNTPVNMHTLDFLKSLPDSIVQCVITSPPYFGLRTYEGDQIRIWGGLSDCLHVWSEDIETNRSNRHGQDGSKLTFSDKKMESSWEKQPASNFCTKCNAWRGALGSEPTLELFISNLVLVFHEVKRVLREDGVLWLNMGDSYYGGNQPFSDSTKMKAHKKGGRGVVKHGKHPVMKKKDLMGVPWKLAFALQEDGWFLRSAPPWIKCLSGGVILYAKTQKGVMPMNVRDLSRLKPGTVELWNGNKWTIMKNCEKIERPENTVEIELRSGERIGCTSDHRWPIKNQGIKSSQNLRIGDLIEKTVLPRPDNMGLCIDETSLGWFVGLYIAEGSISENKIQISGHKNVSEYRYDKLNNFIGSLHGTISIWNDDNSNKSTITIYGKIPLSLIKTYISGNNAKTKHLTRKSWELSNNYLQSLLEGYLHGDGHWDAKNKRWRIIFTRNNYLASDFRCIAARLGISLRLKRGFSKLNEKRFPIWRGQIRFDLSDKSQKSGTWKKKNDNEIIALRSSNARNFYDIEVEDPPNLFSLASGILTHNSNPMPEPVQDRPVAGHEYFFFFSKSGSPTYWINERDGKGTRVKPEPEYVYKDRLTNLEYLEETSDYHNEKVDCPDCGGEKKITRSVKIGLDGEKKEKRTRCMRCKGKGRLYQWVRNNKWRGRDYFYDSETTRIRGVMPAGVQDNREWKDHFDDQQINCHRSGSTSTGTRLRKTGDWFLDSLDNQIRDTKAYLKHLQLVRKKGGLLEDIDGIPMGFLVNLKDWKRGDKQFDGSHFAVFPENLVEPCIRTGSPPKSCSECGSPWEYLVSKEKAPRDNFTSIKTGIEDGWRPNRTRGNEGFGEASKRMVTGSFPTCDCNAEPVPPIILDPFLGSGTIGVVSEKLGRRWLGCDISEEYCGIARKRLGKGRSKREKVLASRNTRLSEF